MPHTDHPLTANRICRCAGCTETFSGLTAFDRHRVDGECVDPSYVGLLITEKPQGSYWADPVALERIQKAFV